MKIFTSADGSQQTIMLNMEESMGLNEVLNTYLDEHGDTGQMALKLVEDTFSKEWS